MDVGSALVASLPGTAAFAIALGVLRARRGTDLDPIAALGELLTQEPHAALAAGAVALLALGALEALFLAAIWGLTGWPIAPLQGGLMGGTQGLAALALPRARSRRRWPAVALGLVAFGAATGMIYSPGI